MINVIELIRRWHRRSNTVAALSMFDDGGIAFEHDPIDEDTWSLFFDD